ncbi:MAG: fibronectin type III domain-containing protein [Candidatus Odinarchaeota archaeon]
MINRDLLKIIVILVLFMMVPFLPATKDNRAYESSYDVASNSDSHRMLAVSKIAASASVAVLNSLSTERPGYFTGGWTNDYQSLYDGLISAGIVTAIVTNEDIISGELTDFDVLFLIDNVPNEFASPIVRDWWLAGGNIISFDSSICFLNWAGILPPEAAGTSGSDVYWNYDSPSTGVVVDDTHPVMYGYSNDQTVYGTSGDAQYYSPAIQGTSAAPYYMPLVKTAVGSDYDLVAAYAPVTGGRVVHIWDYDHWNTASNQQMITNTISWMTVTGNHLRVSLEAPEYPQPGKTAVINGTVINIGSTTETSVEVQLLINNVIVASQSFTDLLVGTSETINYSWMPMIVDTYSITVYAVPVINETYIEDNRASEFVEVLNPVINPLVGTWGLYNTTIYVANDDDTVDEYQIQRTEYGPYVNSYLLNVSYVIQAYDADWNPMFGPEESWITVNTFTRYVEDGTLAAGSWVDMYYLDWGPTGLKNGDSVPIWDGDMVVVGTDQFYINGSWRTAWRAVGDFGFYTMTTWYDRLTGIRIGMNLSENTVGGFWVTGFLNSTNLWGGGVNHQPSILVAYPNGGENLYGPVTIRWYASDPDGDSLTYNVYYWDNSSWVELATGLTKMSYSLDTATLTDGTGYKIRVVASDGSLTAEDESDETFGIDNTQPQPPIVTVISPNGGETFTSGSTATISWTASDPNGDSLTYDVYYKDASFWNLIAPGVTGTSYAWDTTGLPGGTTYKVRVVASDGSLTGEDQSDGYFTIHVNHPPSVTVISPNGGESLHGTVAVSWTASDPDDDSLTYNVYYWDNSSWVELATGVTGTDFSWDTTGLSNGDYYRIRVVASDGAETAEDESDSAFTVENPSTKPASGFEMLTLAVTLLGLVATRSLKRYLKHQKC